MKEAFKLATKTIDGPMGGRAQSWMRDIVSIPKHMFTSIVIITDGLPNIQPTKFLPYRNNSDEVLQLTRSSMKNTKVNITFDVSDGAEYILVRYEVKYANFKQMFV